MLLPSDPKILVNQSIFEEYLLNQSHFFGRNKFAAESTYDLLRTQIPDIINQLTQFPLKYELMYYSIVYKNEPITKAIITGSLKLSNNDSIYIESYWIVKQFSETIEFLTLSRLK